MQLSIAQRSKPSAAPPELNAALRVESRGHGVHAVCFSAMASPCEVLLETPDAALARRVGIGAAEEAWRIECKFSRYREDSVVAAINCSGGRPIRIDRETNALLDFAAQCHQLSDGMFDITSGILRRAWRFDRSDRVPTQSAIEALLPFVGFQKLRRDGDLIETPAGMEVDFGGIGKEYAVDRALAIVVSTFDGAALVNFGGDLCTNAAPASGPWRVGVERPDTDREARMILDLTCGALATSGDTHRFLIRDGVRYGHLLDPRTGWPVRDAPRSVTVAAGKCTDAGMLASFAMLRGRGAERYLAEQDVRYWCLR